MIIVYIYGACLAFGLYHVIKYGWQSFGELLDRLMDKIWHIDNNYYGDE